MSNTKDLFLDNTTQQHSLPEQPSKDIEQVDNETMLLKIKDLKLSLLNRVASTIDTQGDYLEPKDLKQLNDLVLSIESSIIKGPSESNSINVLVQNLLQEYKSDV